MEQDFFKYDKYLHYDFWLLLVRRVEIQAANEISSSVPNAKNIFPLETLGGGVGHGPADSSLHQVFRHRETEKPCELLEGRRGTEPGGFRLHDS